MQRIKVGIIGQGRSGRNIHRHLFETVPKLMERYEVVAVADPIPERTAPSNPGASAACKRYSDYRELLKDPNVELVVNASRSLQHVRVSKEAMEAGNNVISEKPLARTVADADSVFETARRTGRFFAVFQQSRFRPVFTKALELANSGILGRIVMVKIIYNGFDFRSDWQTVQDMCAGSLLNTGPHPLDQALQFYGDADPEHVLCLMDNVNSYGDAEDHVKLLLYGKGHPTIDLEASSCQLYNPYIYQIYASRGSLVATNTEVSWKYCIKEELPENHLKLDTLEGAGRLPTYSGGPSPIYYENKWNPPIDNCGFDYMGSIYYQNIYEAILHGAPLKVTWEQVRRQIAVIEECHRQNPLPKTVKVDPLTM
ncbi:MAG: Gfo/Idh/MocA family oxidoreductase [Lentisphaeria bacterium]|nr:Gfo/Idh/MocA family oxidoreductase [Lentisphaeria bacterium]